MLLWQRSQGTSIPKSRTSETGFQRLWLAARWIPVWVPIRLARLHCNPSRQAGRPISAPLVESLLLVTSLATPWPFQHSHNKTLLSPSSSTLRRLSLHKPRNRIFQKLKRPTCSRKKPTFRTFQSMVILSVGITVPIRSTTRSRRILDHAARFDFLRVLRMLRRRRRFRNDRRLWRLHG